MPAPDAPLASAPNGRHAEQSARGLTIPDAPDPEAAALAQCYALARDRARLLRQAAGESTQPTHPPRRVLRNSKKSRGGRDTTP